MGAAYRIRGVLSKQKHMLSLSWKNKHLMRQRMGEPSN